jgi:hypothetical protein
MDTRTLSKIRGKNPKYLETTRAWTFVFGHESSFLPSSMSSDSDILSLNKGRGFEHTSDVSVRRTDQLCLFLSESSRTKDFNQLTQICFSESQFNFQATDQLPLLLLLSLVLPTRTFRYRM